MNLVFLGPPGAGKGTQARLLADKFNLHHLSTGDILRCAVANKTELGNLVENILKAGGLVDDSVVNNLVADAIINLPEEQGFILDGYPRTVEQAESLFKVLSSLNRSIDTALAFDVDFGVLIGRVQARVEENNKQGEQARADDTPEVLKNRLISYETQTAPLLNFYEKQGILKRVNAMLSIEEVFSSIVNILKI